MLPLHGESHDGILKYRIPIGISMGTDVGIQMRLLEEPGTLKVGLNACFEAGKIFVCRRES